MWYSITIHTIQLIVLQKRHCILNGVRKPCFCWLCVLETLAVLSLFWYLRHKLGKTAKELVKHPLWYQLLQLSEAGDYFHTITCWGEVWSGCTWNRPNPDGDAPLTHIMYNTFYATDSSAFICFQIQNLKPGNAHRVANKDVWSNSVLRLTCKPPHLQMKTDTPSLYLQRVGRGIFLFT